MKTLAFAFSAALLLGLPGASAQNNVTDPSTGVVYEWQTFPGGFTGAKLWVTARGGMLTDIRNAVENDFIKNSIIPISGPLRIALDDAAVSGTFVWSNGAPYTFRNWAAGEPNLQAGLTETVVAAAGTWSQAASAVPSTWLMKYPKFSVYNPTTGSLYVLGSPFKTPAQAEAEALAMGGHLATFGSAAEETFVRDAVNRVIPNTEYLIGFSDRDLEGTFRWLNGECVSYTNWAPGEPSNSSATKDAVMSFMQGSVGRWKTIATTSTFLRALIEIDDLELAGEFGFEGASGCVFPTNSSLTGTPLVPTCYQNLDAGVSNPANITLNGMPSEGTQCAWVQTNGLLLPPASYVFTPPGGPLLQPYLPGFSRLSIPLPDDVASIDFDWEFLNCGYLSNFINDTASVVIISPGNVVRTIEHVDSYREEEAQILLLNGIDACLGGISNTYHQVMPIGHQHASASFLDATGQSTIPPGSTLCVVITNSQITNNDSVFLMDALRITRRTFNLEMSTATGPGSFKLQSRFGPPGALVFRAVQLDAPTCLTGWFYGINIDPIDLSAQFNAGYPFTAILDATGADTFIVPSGVVPGLPLVATSIILTGATPPVIASRPVTFITQ